jgi:2-dehydropantoate 2-reductase
VVLLAVKSDATLDAVRALAAVAPPSIAVVSLQNGVANEGTILRWFGCVYGVCVMAPTAHIEPGSSRRTATRPRRSSTSAAIPMGLM